MKEHFCGVKRLPSTSANFWPKHLFCKIFFRFPRRATFFFASSMRHVSFILVTLYLKCRFCRLKRNLYDLRECILLRLCFSPLCIENAFQPLFSMSLLLFPDILFLFFFHCSLRPVFTKWYGFSAQYYTDGVDMVVRDFEFLPPVVHLFFSLRVLLWYNTRYYKNVDWKNREDKVYPYKRAERK